MSKSPPTITPAHGFAETLLALPALAPVAYSVRAKLCDAREHTLATVTSQPWTLPSTPWVGNALGMTDAVQPPWTPIKVAKTGFQVWGREYNIAGGFGLPVQITSLARALLAQPVTLEISKGGQMLPLTDCKVQLGEAKPDLAHWSGTATAGDVRVRVDGSLTYDGMVLLTLQLAPATPGKTVHLDGVKLQTRLPRERALFLNTSTDQGYWWYPYKGWVPEQTGVVYDNLKQRAAKTNFLFYVLFSDDDTGLEWFADNTAGRQIDDRKPVQEIIREDNGDVRLQCLLANIPFELDGSHQPDLRL